MEVFDGVLVPPRLIHLVGKLAEEHAPVGHLMRCVRDIYWQAFWRRRYFRTDRIAQLFQRNIRLADFLGRGSLENALFCYKEPFLCFAAAAFASEFAGAKFLHLIRDGRDNADSLERCYPHELSDEVLKNGDLVEDKNTGVGYYRVVDSWHIPWWIPTGQEREFVELNRYGRYLWMWREMTERAMALASIVGEERYREVRYEELVRDPLSLGKVVTTFLGKELNARTRRALKKAFTSSVKVGSRNADTQRLQQARNIAGSLLLRLGYD
jgi:hypothetical protein